jgi:hypothetical protein
MRLPKMPRWVLFLGLLPALFMLWLGGPMIWPLWAGILFVPSVIRGRWQWRWRALLLTPITVAALAFASGVLGYVTGTGRLEYMGMPSAEFYNLDPVTRAHKSTGGCVVMGTEFLTQDPNNAAIEGLSKLFGPMPGSYRGPYPTREESLALLLREDLGLATPPGTPMPEVPRIPWQDAKALRAAQLDELLIEEWQPAYLTHSHVRYVTLFDQKRQELIATYAEYEAL